MNGLKRLLNVCLVISFASFLFIPSAFSGDQNDLMKLKPGQPIVVNGDKVEYFETEGRIVAEGNVSITYGDAKLTCNRIEVDTKSRTALCEGNVRIEEPQGVLTGDRIQYDFDKEKGELLGLEVKAYPWFGKAEEVARVSEDEFLLKKGYVTTCDLEEPHYRVSAEEIRLFPEQKVIAKNVVVYIGKVPVMWFPYYYHPIIENRAKVQLIPGYNSDWGYFLLSAWRFYITGNSKVDVLVDYRTRKGFAEGADFYYHAEDFGLKGLGDGVLRAYFIEQNDVGTMDPKAFGDEGEEPVLRKRIQVKHRVEFDPETVGMLEFNKLSDRDVLKDYFYNEYEENNIVPQNYASIISAKPNYTFLFNAEKRFDDFFTVTQKLPEVKMDIPDQRLWDTPLYYGSEMSSTYFDKQYEGLSSPPEKVGRLDSYHKFSYMSKLGFLNITPYGEVRETVYTRNKWDNDPKARSAFGAGVALFSRFHKIYDVKTDYMGLDINGMRHIIVPSATYFHTHQPTVDKDELYQMDELDTLEKENGVTLALENKFQTKRGEGETAQSVDVVRFITSTDFLFRMEKDEFKFEKEGKFTNLKYDLELMPYSWLYFDNEMEIIPSNQSIGSTSVEASIRPNENFRFDFGYRYEKLDASPRNQWTFDLSYRLNPKWKFGLYERFDFQTGVIEEQQISVTRDLHCWEVEFVYDVDGSNFLEDDFTVWFAFKIKAFPDLQLGLDRSYRKDIPGSNRLPASTN